MLFNEGRIFDPDVRIYKLFDPFMLGLNFIVYKLFQSSKLRKMDIERTHKLGASSVD